jgi:hypothetical protein
MKSHLVACLIQVVLLIPMVIEDSQAFHGKENEICLLPLLSDHQLL